MNLLAVPSIIAAALATAPRASGEPRQLAEGDGDPAGDATCSQPRDLEEFPQWREEVGYWLGDLSFYGADGTPFESAGWNYPYDNYKGFITGAISGGSYRQRNIFVYPPQAADKCDVDPPVTGNGTCGTNGNSKIFFADQSAAAGTCDGTLEGPFGPFDTKTTLVGEDNALLYQVLYQGALFQSQLTTLSGNGRRTRSAHNFDTFGPEPSVPTQCSFYRERRVNKTEFYDALEATLAEYVILDEDACTRDGQGALLPGITGGYDACVAHLEESFALGQEGGANSTGAEATEPADSDSTGAEAAEPIGADSTGAEEDGAIGTDSTGTEAAEPAVPGEEGGKDLDGSADDPALETDPDADENDSSSAMAGSGHRVYIAMAFAMVPILNV